MADATRRCAPRPGRPLHRRMIAAAVAAAVVASAPLIAQALGRRPPPRMLSHPPAQLADVVGRDLHIFGLGFLGHLGVWTGGSVIEVLDEPTVVQERDLVSFIGGNDFWGSVYYPGIESLPGQWKSCVDTPDVSAPYCPQRLDEPGAAFAVVRRAQHAKIIGAFYTLSTSYRPFAYGSWGPGGPIGPQPGIYRSDAFVRDMFVSTADAWVADNSGGGPPLPRPIVLPEVSVPRDLYLYLAER